MSVVCIRQAKKPTKNAALQKFATLQFAGKEFAKLLMIVKSANFGGLNRKGLCHMPIKTGALTDQEQAFVDALANSGDAAYAFKAAGYKGARNLSYVMKRPAIQKAIVDAQQARLVNEALPAAVSCIIEIIRNPKAPAAARVQAAKLTFDRVLPQHLDGSGKEPHEMTPEELAAAIDKLESIAAGKARAIEPPEPQQSGIFG
jgi:phage terminase small subunit